MKTLSIIDGSGFMFRARYAFPPLLNAAGQNQNVVYGTLRMLLKLISESADYFVIARDSPTKTKRHEQYQDYKANRKKMEDEFKVQIPLLREFINELQIPNIAAP
jgi:DNA-directed DNA polymerase